MKKVSHFIEVIILTTQHLSVQQDVITIKDYNDRELITVNLRHIDEFSH